MSSLDRYQESYQGVESVRRAEADLDQWGNPVRRAPDYFDDLNRVLSEEELDARRAADAAYKKRLAERIRGAMSQMEMICPPRGGAA